MAESEAVKPLPPPLVQIPGHRSPEPQNAEGLYRVLTRPLAQQNFLELPPHGSVFADLSTLGGQDLSPVPNSINIDQAQ